MIESLKKKWFRLRLMRVPGMYEINYRIIRNTAKIMGGRHAH